jgi:hypothetical protein
MAEKKATKTAKLAAKKADGEIAVPAKIAAMPEPYRGPGQAPPRAHPVQRAGASADHVVWHAGKREGQQDRLLLPRGEEMHDLRLHQEANLTREEGATHQLLTSVWYSPRWTTRPRPGSPPSCARRRADGAPCECLAGSAPSVLVRSRRCSRTPS